MAYVKTIPDGQATGLLAEVHEEVKQYPIAGRPGGQVWNIWNCVSLRPEAVRSVARLATTLAFGASTLGRVREEMLATAVSAVNHCRY